jgi:hypothetical protein
MDSSMAELSTDGHEAGMEQMELLVKLINMLLVHMLQKKSLANKKTEVEIGLLAWRNWTAGPGEIGLE